MIKIQKGIDEERGKKILLLFTLHVSLDIRQHFNENNDEEGKKNEGIATHTNWFIQLLKSTSSSNSRQCVCVVLFLLFRIIEKIDWTEKERRGKKIRETKYNYNYHQNQLTFVERDISCL